MTKFMKIIALVMAVAMLASCVIGCGKQDADPSSDGNTDAGTFKVGLTGPLTGDTAIYGSAAQRGAQIAFDEINALGGVQFEFKAEDDLADGETAVNAYNNLVDWGMQMFIGTVTSGAGIAVSSVAYEDRMFALTPSASSVDVIDGKDNVYQVCFTDPNQGIGSADYMAENMKDAKIAIIYRNDDAYSQGIHDTFVAEAKEKGLEVVYEGTFTKDTQTDFSVQLTAAKVKEADTIFLPIYYQPASVILTQAKDMGYAPVFFGVDGMDGILTMEGFDPTLAEGVMLLTPFSADAKDEKTQNFVKAYNDKYGETPNQFAADGYDAAYIFYQAVKASGVTADMKASDICEKFIETFKTLSFDGVTGTGMTWKETGEVSKAPMAVVIKDGAYVLPESK